jgi:ribosomal 50S subunit-recycling heat shock protein
MTSVLKWVSAMVASVLLAGTVTAAETVSAGKVKTINADKKEFVMTDSAGKDWTFKLGNKVVINRGGKESQSDLKVGDPVNVMYDKGVLTWTARYILVQEGDAKNEELMYGAVKSYDAKKKQLAFTDEDGKERTFEVGEAKVRLCQKDGKTEDGKMDDAKIGDHALAIVEKAGNKVTLKSLMIERK